MQQDNRNSSLRLALCSAGELFGGVERHLLGLCTYFNRLGWNPTLILFHDRELAAQARMLGIEPTIIRSRNSYDFAAVSKVREELASKQINVVHAHGYKAVVICALARRAYPFAMVRTVHGRVEPFDGNILNWCKSKIYYKMEEIASRESEAVVCYVTEDARSSYRERRVNKKNYVVYNGIEPLDPTQTKRPNDLLEEFFHLCIIGRITVVKGISIALRAISLPQIPPRIHLNIIGTGPQQAQLERETCELGINDRVHFLGFKRNIYDYIKHADVILMPSLHEGLPYTLLEAMSLGTVIIASRIGGLAEVLRDGETALLHNPGDFEGLRAKILLVYENHSLGTTLELNAMRDQKERFTLSGMCEKYIQIHTAALEGLKSRVVY